MITFRFDDISVNTDADKLRRMVEAILDKWKDVQIIFAVSVGVFDTDRVSDTLEKERTFPAILHVESDFRVFYLISKIGIPHWLEAFKQSYKVEVASHGIVHVDHRLMSKKAQELSIMVSCSLLNTKTFVPPFHKFNKKTEKVCKEQEIFLQRRDSTWFHLKYNPVDNPYRKYYFHTHDFTCDEFCARISQPIKQ